MRLSYFILLLIIVFFSSCSTTKYLGEEELLLTKNSISFEKDYKIANKGKLKLELESLYRQRPNTPIFLVFSRVPIYYKLENYRKDTSNHTVEYRQFLKDSNGFYQKDSLKETATERGLRTVAENKIAEPPALFNEDLMEVTRKQMENVLHSKGFFNAKVDARTHIPPRKGSKGKVISKKVEVTYHITSKNLYTIGSVEFICEDPSIQNILDETANNSFLKKNSPVDGILYDQEVNRITTTLRNRGYATFTSNYVSKLKGDTSNFKTNIVLEVVAPREVNRHKTYMVGEVFVYPNYNPIISDSMKADTILDGLHFIKENGSVFWIKPKRLRENIFIKSGELYNQADINKTNRKLSDLGIFRFVNIRQQEDPQRPGVINFSIQITPRNKWEIGYGIEPNFTERNITNSPLNLLGVSGNTFLGNKNLFHGAERFSTNAFAGLEFDINNSFALDVIDLKLQNNLDIPRFTGYLGVYKGLNKLKILSDSRLASLKDKAVTSINLDYNFLAINRFYTYHLFNAGWGFDYQEGKNRFIFNNLSIDILRPINIDTAFQNILDDNLFLANSFGDQLFTGFVLRDFTYIFKKPINSFGESYFIQIYTDVSGAEILAANKIYNEINNTIDTLTLGSNFEFSQYAKFEINASFTKKYTRKTAFATRINIGIAAPFGFSDEVPYVKQFFVGGPQSIRAWGARGLGPGSFQDSLTINANNRLLFYQTGDFKFEINGEFRQELATAFWGRLEGALFLDIGNVWTLKEDNDGSRPGGVLQWRPRIDANGEEIGDNFIKELAIGTGIGFRFDFEYFLLRFDLGYRVKNPYKTTFQDGTSTYLPYRSLSELNFGDINYNLGMNYPF